jgi:hypothetical protein
MIECIVNVEDADDIGRKSISVIDPDANYVASELDCEAQSSGGPPSNAHQSTSEPAEQTENLWAQHMLPEDEVQHVGYREQDRPVVAIIRDGQVVLIQPFISNEEGEWEPDAYVACATFF